MVHEVSTVTFGQLLTEMYLVEAAHVKLERLAHVVQVVSQQHVDLFAGEHRADRERQVDYVAGAHHDFQRFEARTLSFIVKVANLEQV